MFPICQGRSSGEPTHEPMSLLFSPNISAEMSLDLHQYITLKSANTKKKKVLVQYTRHISSTKQKYHYQQNKTLLCSRYSSVVRLKYAGGYGNALKSCLYYWSQTQ